MSLRRADVLQRWPARAATVFAALGDETRLGLVRRLAAEGPLSLRSLTVGSRVTRQAVAKHLRVLSQSGLVHGARRGRESRWTLEKARLQEAQAHLATISSAWDVALDRLAKLVSASPSQ